MSTSCMPHKQRQSGQSLVEFAMVMPFLILIIMGVFDLGWAVYANNTISLAAREGARVGIISTKTDAQICAQAQATSQSLSIECSVSPSPNRQSGGTVAVTITYTYTPITPLIGNILGNGGQLTLTSMATMYVE